MLPDPPVSIQKQVKPFLSRAKEVESINSPISYFCKLYVAQLILDKNLHKNNNEVTSFVSLLLNEIENMKQNANDDLKELLNNETKGLNYVKNFAFDIFNNLNIQVDNQSVDKKTAIGFIANVNFLELIKLWGENDEGLMKDLNDRIKYCKFQAARILKAYKNGEDPNDYIPAHKKKKDEEEEALKKLEQDLKAEGIEEDDKEIKFEENDKEDAADSSIVSISPPPLVQKPLIEDEEELSKLTPINTSIPKFIDDDDDTQETIKNTLTPPPIKPKHTPIVKTDQSVDEIIKETEVITQAQKHAKFAISALNYEDKLTAIEELKRALQILESSN